MGDTNSGRVLGMELMDNRHSGVAPEEHAESPDIMYENTADPDPPGRNHPLPTTGRGRRLMTGFRKWSPCLCLLCSVMCLLLSVAVVVLIVKYILVSKQPETPYRTLDINVTETPGSGEELWAPLRRELATTRFEQKTHAEPERAARGKVDLNSPTTQSWAGGEDDPQASPIRSDPDLEETSLKLAKAVREITDLKKSLRQEEQKASTNRLAMEEMLRDTRLKMGQWEKELCPEGWLLFRKTCLWISPEKTTWTNSHKDCEEKDSNLIMVAWNDTALQHSMAGKKEGFWVGKELTWRWPVQWRWPSSYHSIQDSTCWMMTAGNLQNVSCSDNNRWICEKNLVLTSFLGSAYNSLEFDLWRAKFSCYRKSS